MAEVTLVQYAGLPYGFSGSQKDLADDVERSPLCKRCVHHISPTDISDSSEKQFSFIRRVKGQLIDEVLLND